MKIVALVLLLALFSVNTTDAQTQKPTQKAEAAVVAPNQKSICGTVSELTMSSMSWPTITPVTLIKFEDGRSISLTGLVPEIDVLKGKMYTFVVGKSADRFGRYTLFETKAANICGYPK